MLSKRKAERTYRKKISLYPLNFKDAVSALLKVKPKRKMAKKTK
jgi:hypothetical protein